jgi:chromosome segregation ATPase
LAQKTEEIANLTHQLEQGKWLLGVKITIEGGFTPEEIAEIQAELALERAEIVEERKSLQQKAEDLALIVAAKATQVDHLQTTLSAANAQISSLRGEIDSLNSAKIAMETAVKLVKEELKASEEQLIAQKHLSESIDFDLQSAQNDKKTLLSEVESVSKCLKEAENGKITLQSILDRTREDLASRTKSLETVKQQLQAIISNRKLNAEMTFRLIQEGNAVLGLSMRSSSEALSFEEVLEAFKMHNARLKAVQSDLDSGLNRVIERFGGSVKPSNDLSAAGGKLIQLMEVSLSSLNELQSEAGEAERLYSGSKQEITDLKRLIEELNRSAESYAKSASQSDKANIELKQQLDAREEERQQLFKVAMEKSELETVVKTLQTQIREQAARLGNEGDMQRTLTEENQSLKVLLERAVSQLNDTKEADLMLKADKDQLNAELDATRMSLATLSQQVQALEDHNQSLATAVEAMQSSETALGSANTELMVHLAELEAVVDEKDGEICTWKQACQQMEATIKELKSEVNAREMELETASKSLESNLKATEAVKEEAKLLLSKVTGQVTNAENIIDRRYISTFLFNYLNPRNSDRLKSEMLERMVNVLGLSDEQRQALGIGPETGLLADLASYISKED